MDNVRLTIAAIALLSASGVVPNRYAEAQTPPAASAARAVIAATKLPTVVNTPLYFRVVNVTLPAGQSSSFEGPAGIIYQLSGSTEVSINGDTGTLDTGSGMFVADGSKASLRAMGGAPSVFLHFLLTPAADERSVAAAPARAEQLFQTAAPIPALKSGPYDLNLTRITFPPHMPSNPQHYRSGAAVYDILSGTGANTVGGKTGARPAGSLIYEPFGLVHQWGNPGDAPLTFLAFNINPAGTAAVLRGTPGKAP